MSETQVSAPMAFATAVNETTDKERKLIGFYRMFENVKE